MFLHREMELDVDNLKDNTHKIILIECNNEDGLPINIEAMAAYIGFRKNNYTVILCSYFNLSLGIKDVLKRYTIYGDPKEFIECCFGKINFTRAILRELGIKEQEPLDTILFLETKENIKRHLDRRLQRYKRFKDYYLEYTEKVLKGEAVDVFIKPVNLKEFYSSIVSSNAFFDNELSMENFMKLNDGLLNDDTPILVSDVIDIKSEWRLYVHKGHVVGVANYLGEPTVFPDTDYLEGLALDKKYIMPVSYVIDVGVIHAPNPDKFNLIDYKTVIIELNDFWAIGLYGGLSEELFAEMLLDRWNQLKEGLPGTTYTNFLKDL
jgi:hypothetical protein